MENQHRKITGYRELSQEEIDLMNDIKAEGTRLGELYDRLSRMMGTPGGISPDARWAAIGRTHLQEGLMALTRSIAKPESF